MTNYDKIVAILKCGHLAMVEQEGRKIICSSIMSNGVIRTTDWYDIEREAMDCLGEYRSNDKFLNGLELSTITCLYQKPELLKVGDKVDVSEEAEYFAGDNGLKISEVREDCYIIGGWHIPFWAVSPHLEEDDEKEPSNKELLEKLGKCLEECKDLVNRL